MVVSTVMAADSAPGSDVEAGRERLDGLVSEFRTMAERSVVRRELTDKLSSIITAAAVCFRDEEVLMERIDFPGRQRQHELHVAFIADMLVLAEEFAAGNLVISAADIEAHIGLWTAEHEREESRLIGEYLRTRAGKAAASVH